MGWLKRWLWAGVLLMSVLGSTPARAEYVSNFPYRPSGDVWDTYYGYPYVSDAADVVYGYRTTAAIPSANRVKLDIAVDTTWLYCYGYLQFYFDGVYLGYAELDPAYYYVEISGDVTIPAAQVANTTSHLLEVELYNDIWYCPPYPYIGYIAFYEGSSTVSIDLVGADNDADGHYSTTYYGDDCNDSDPTIYAGRPEACDGKDNDCNGVVDNGVGNTYYRDADGDGWGNGAVTVKACSAPTGYVGTLGDCNDSDASIYPGATESCDGKDNDCDSVIDDGVKVTFYDDDDGDSWGDSADTTQACAAPTGYVGRGGDCDDTNSGTYPNAPEKCNGRDDNCNSAVDEGVTTTFYLDGDGDQYGAGTTTQACSRPSGYAAVGGDCNDADASIYPSAPELCDQKDNDCDGSKDEGATTTFYPDGDADGYGVSAGSTQACSRPSGYATVAGDCNDASASVNPAAAEACNGVDDNCNSAIDEGVLTTWYQDADGDQYGTTTTTTACAKPSGYASVGGDCNDGDATIYPSAPELCDQKDNDCDTVKDEGATTTFYRDVDGDGVGIASTTTQACSAPSGYAASSGDCNDGDATIYPGAPELCDQKDNDCDGAKDEGVTTTAYQDADGDSWGNPAVTQATCSPPSGYVARAGDCNDQSAAIHPEAAEVCDGVDNDCDGFLDDGVASTWYADTDGDSWGDGGSTRAACSAPSGYVGRAGDCNDRDAATHPQAAEICDLKDNDCDLEVDEGAQATWYLDGDRDGFGIATSTAQACSAPSGYAGAAGDCNDADATVYPGAPEICDGQDDDCDGTADDGVGTTWYQDVDADGYGTQAVTTVACSRPSGYAAAPGDCNDNVSSVNPGASEVCDGVDQDCDGVADDGVLSLWYPDGDGDGYGTGSGVQACSRPSGSVSQGGDCNDASATVYPGAAELCDAIDQDCDGSASDATPFPPLHPDADGDGYGDAHSTVQSCPPPAGATSDASDCNDTFPGTYPGAVEKCDGVDQDCDGTVDEEVKSTFYLDADGDAHGDPLKPRKACKAPAGYVVPSDDCNDQSAQIYPGATEVCDQLDQDCDSKTDEGVQTTFYADQDLDTFGDDATTTVACARPNGYVAAGGDCDDTTADLSPNAEGRCRGAAGDCDGAVDEGVQITLYVDGDADGYGDSAQTHAACGPEEGYAEAGRDCDDLDPGVYPGAEEVCGDDIDQDCNGYLLSCDDADHDGDGWAPSAGDCDDEDAAIHPDAEELCDGVDQDCDGDLDDRDEDGDGHVAAACGGGDCDDTDPGVSPDAAEVCGGDGIPRDEDCSGVIDDRDFDADGAIAAVCGGDDCDDLDPRESPTGEELCDGLDNDCSGVVDDRDEDGDGYISGVCGGEDCDDTDPNTYPGADEIEGGGDEDCDGRVDEGSEAFDDDGDGYTENGGDCNDGDPSVNPGVFEDPGNGVDDDCDGETDEVDATPTPGGPTPTPVATPTPSGTPTAPWETPTAGPTDATPTTTASPSGTEATPAPTPSAAPTATTPADQVPSETPGIDGVTPSVTVPPADDCSCASTRGGAGGALSLLLAALALRPGRRRRD